MFNIVKSNLDKKMCHNQDDWGIFLLTLTLLIDRVTAPVAPPVVFGPLATVYGPKPFGLQYLPGYYFPSIHIFRDLQHHH